MSHFNRVTAIIVLLAMIGAWCPPCMVAMQVESSCCSQPCDDCACGFEAMPADMDSAPAAAVASALTLDPVLASSYLAHFASLSAGSRTSLGRTRGSDLPSPPSSSTRLSILSVYLI